MEFSTAVFLLRFTSLPPSPSLSHRVRIHWAIVVFSVIGTILLTWHFRTRKIDFMTPAGVTLAPEDDGSDLAVGAPALQPTINKQGQMTTLLGNPEEPEEVEMTEITDADLGDLDAAPGLAAYRSFARQEAPSRVFELSSTLRARGQFQRALLALERVIDTSEPDPEALAEAAKGITALAPTLPQWNVDPIAELPLNLHLSSARDAPESVKAAALKVATLIKKSSGDQLEIIPKILSNGTKNALPDSPLALWLATTGDQSASTAVITLRVTDDAEAAFAEIAKAVSQAVRSRLVKEEYVTPPPLKATSEELISVYITRLMWRDFAQSLVNPAEDPEGSATTDEN